MKYRIELTIDAKDRREAAELLCAPDQWAGRSRVKITDVNQWRTVRLAAVLAGAIVIYVAALGGLVAAWVRIPH